VTRSEFIAGMNVKIMGSRTSQHKNAHVTFIRWLCRGVSEFGVYLFTPVRNFGARVNIIVFLIQLLVVSNGPV
jgi:hypothetical protein